ncbi:MAG: amidohydrolase family protein [Hellea sp.]|nr:amidohydrolase family protein [Hellea sp.]
MLIDCDLYIKNGLMFDGSGEYPVINDIAISKGLVVAIGKNLKVTKNVDTIDASNEWVMPGLLDIHTHYDLEIEVSPGLKESIRHGTTTVVMSNCSLGLAFGSQRKDNDDPIVSCFARVENIPKHVLKKVADKVYWSSSSEYIKHLNKLKLGPNVVPMIPHSMLRIEVMGLKDSVSRNPTSKELGKMKSLLKQGLDEGYVGFSTDSLPFHFLANDPNRNKQIPTQFAPFSELKSLTSIVRDYDRVWQATPPKDNPFKVVRTFLLTSGRLYKKPLKTTVVAALDIKSNGSIIKLARTLARILNSKLIGGKFYMQALGAPFKIWSDGLFNPLSEEIDEMRELIETDLDDRQARVLILENEDFRKRFKKMWMKGKVGLNLARLKRLINREDYAFNRNLGDMFIDRCPISRWIGLSFQEVYDDIKVGNVPVGFESIKDEPDFILAMLKVFDTDLVWNTTSANRDPYQTRKLLMDPLLLPGFNDSGAHLTNMAFYDCNLRSLNIAQEGGILDVSYMVKRLTRDAANIFGIAGGQIKVGERADITIVNPEELEVYDGENSVQRIYREDFEHEQLVNRSDGVVTATIVSGRAIWQNSKFANDINKSKYGKCLLAS